MKHTVWHIITRLSRTSLVIAIALAAGCGGKQPALVASPNLYVDSTQDPFALVPPELRTNTAQVVFATDRFRQAHEGGGWHYGSKRSRTTKFGLATVTMGQDMSWSDLASASCAAKRNKPVALEGTDVDQCGYFAELPPAVEVDGRWVDPPEYLQRVDRAAEHLRKLVSQQLARTPRKELYVFIHGYNNTFESGCFRVAQIWHFAGRGGVPVLFSWPAGSSGLLRGYTRDRESGEFASPHLKIFLRTLASCPDVQKIHLIAHSRGTDVLATAVRELHLECRGAGRDTRTELKLGQAILAAPDIDLDVFIEKFSADRVGFVAERLTIYVSSRDKALSLSDWLFGSARRLGQLAVGDVDPRAGSAIDNHPILNIVDMRAKTDRRGHGYFLSSPACLSDVILVLRDGRAPGAANGRPLIDRPSGFWELRDGYPTAAK
ncbi:MAG: alpha/beta hydrolase [Phycisphaerales bacterium]|nr:alpha/beta hydrolase [Phycisphaerales bacterium]MCI0675978.1 alpha/beta hydrolase [Phycisphaerales bacterium]